MLRYSFPPTVQSHQLYLQTWKFLWGLKMSTRNLKSGTKCLCLQCYWKKDLWNCRFTMVPGQLWDSGVFFVANLLLHGRWTDGSPYLLQGEHFATSSVGIFDYFISSQEHKYGNLKPKKAFHTTPTNAELLVLYSSSKSGQFLKIIKPIYVKIQKYSLRFILWQNFTTLDRISAL